jgi:hypothetical protein
MWDFYKDLVWRAPGILLRALVRTDTTFDIISKLALAIFVGVSNPITDPALGLWNRFTGNEVKLNGFPLWWSVILLGIIFLHGLFRYAHEDKLRVERDLGETRVEKRKLEERLKAYEGRGGASLVTVVEKGPVSIQEQPPYLLREHRESASISLVCLVPFKAYTTAREIENEPTATLTVEDAGDAYTVAVSYEVQATTPYSMQRQVMDIETRVQVVGKDGGVVRDLSVYSGSGEFSGPEAGTWRRAVSGSSTLMGLPQGVYSLHVLDYVNMVGARDNGQREYRNMRLRVSKMAT